MIFLHSMHHRKAGLRQPFFILLPSISSGKLFDCVDERRLVCFYRVSSRQSCHSSLLFFSCEAGRQLCSAKTATMYKIVFLLFFFLALTTLVIVAKEERQSLNISSPVLS